MAGIFFFEADKITPYETPISQGLCSGTRITLFVRINDNPNSMAVNLRLKPTDEKKFKKEEKDKKFNYALHFSARWDEGKTVLNNRIDGKWGTEEHKHFDSLTAGSNSVISFTCTAMGIDIQVNHESLTFRHRCVDLSNINCLEVRGACTIDKVHMERL